MEGWKEGTHSEQHSIQKRSCTPHSINISVVDQYSRVYCTFRLHQSQRAAVDLSLSWLTLIHSQLSFALNEPTHRCGVWEERRKDARERVGSWSKNGAVYFKVLSVLFTRLTSFQFASREVNKGPIISSAMIGGASLPHALNTEACFTAWIDSTASGSSVRVPAMENKVRDPLAC